MATEYFAGATYERAIFGKYSADRTVAFECALSLTDGNETLGAIKVSGG